MIRACAADEQCPGSPLAKRCLWISAVVTYAKALRGGKGRKAFDADGYVTRHLSKERLRLHKYLMKLRDRMIAHDDSLGAKKTISIYPPPHEPRQPPEFSLGGGQNQVVLTRSDLPQESKPNSEGM